MRAFSKIGFGILLVIAVALFIISLHNLMTGRMNASARLYESATVMQVIAGGTEGMECDGLQIGVLQKEFTIKEGEKIMNECILTVYNCGPGPVEVSKVPIEWELGKYYEGTGYIELGEIDEGDYRLISCIEVFGDLPVVEIETSKFIIDKIPLKVTLDAPTGESSEEWEVTYISKKGIM